jgi:cation:H+ antiporter
VDGHGLNPLLMNAIVLLAALAVLGKSSQITISRSVELADITGFGKTTVGFLLIALSTSLPELSVSVFSTTTEEAVGVAIGNVLGSNIVNVCLVLGASILYASLKQKACIDFLPIITEDEIKTLQLGLFGASLIPLGLIYLGYASRAIGLVLIAAFLVNTYNLSRQRESYKEEGALGEERKMIPRLIAFIIIGVTGVLVCSYYIVEAATFIALSIGIPKVVIGATIVAFGTSIPELATSIEATRNDALNLALGNIVGSGLLNLTLILGVTLSFSNFTINIGAFTNVAVFSLIANLFLWYFLSGDRVCWREGAVLVVLYLTFLVTSFRGYPT